MNDLEEALDALQTTRTYLMIARNALLAGPMYTWNVDEPIEKADAVLLKHGKIQAPLGLCTTCYTKHELDPADSFVDFNGRRFRPPFHCLCCDKVICGRQFAFGRCCGYCDTGACIHNPQHPPHVKHRNFGDNTLFEKYGEAISVLSAP